MSIVSLDQLQSGLEKAKEYTDSLNSTVATTVSEALTEMESVKADKTDLDGYATTDYVDEAVSGLTSGTSGEYANLIDYDEVEAVEDVTFSTVTLDAWQSAVFAVTAGETYTVTASSSLASVGVYCNIVWLDSGQAELSTESDTLAAGASASATAPDGACYAYVQWCNGMVSSLVDVTSSSTDVAFIGPTTDADTLTAYHTSIYEAITSGTSADTSDSSDSSDESTDSDSTVDLSGYVTTDGLAETLESYATTEAVATAVSEAVSGLATTEYVDEAISNITGSDSEIGLTEDDVNTLIEAYMTANYDNGEETTY